MTIYLYCLLIISFFYTPLAISQEKCHQYFSGDPAVYDSFGVPYNVFSKNQELLITAQCSGSNVYIGVGDDDECGGHAPNIKNLLIDEYIYLLIDNNWKAVKLEPTGSKFEKRTGGYWIACKGYTNLKLTDQQLRDGVLLAARICYFDANDSMYKCNCRDETCKPEKDSVLQEIKVKEKPKFEHLLRKTECDSYENNLQYGIFYGHWATVKINIDILKKDLTEIFRFTDLTDNAINAFDQIFSMADLLSAKRFKDYPGAKYAASVLLDMYKTTFSLGGTVGTTFVEHVLEGLTATLNPNAFDLFSYVAFNSASIFTKFIGTVAIKSKVKEFHTYSAINQVIDLYYKSCQDFDYIAKILDIPKYKEGCSHTTLVCLEMEYVEKYLSWGSKPAEVDPNVLNGINTEILMNVNDLSRKLQ